MQSFPDWKCWRRRSIPIVATIFLLIVADLHHAHGQPKGRFFQSQTPDPLPHYPDPSLCDEAVLKAPVTHNIWLHSLIGADHPGSLIMLRHWLAHYMSWGFAKEHMLLVLHKNTTEPEAEHQYQQLKQFLESNGIGYTTWNETYSSNAHSKLVLTLFQRNIKSPYDWIAYADSDEFIDYNKYKHQSVRDFANWLEVNGYTASKASFLDHLSADAKLRDVTDSPTIWQQFPMGCDMIGSGFITGRNDKAILYRAWYRTGNGNHEIINAEYANTYFGPHPSGPLNPRMGFYGAEDLRHFTPYFMYRGCYRFNSSDPEAHPSGYPYFNSSPNVYTEQLIKVHHFKWHPGIISAARARLDHYKGPKRLNPKIPPRFVQWRRYEIILQTLAFNDTVPVQGANCWNELQYNKHFIDILQTQMGFGRSK